MSEWETFCDESYYHLWRVRRKSDRNFNDGFHVQDGKEATALVELLNGLEHERDEAREDAAHWKTEYLIVAARLCGKKHPRDNGIISEHEIIPKLTQERNEARETLREIAAADWQTSGELRGMARRSLEGAK